MSKKKKIIIVGSILAAIAIILSLYIYLSDNYRIAKLPKEIIAVELDATTVFLIPTVNGYLLVDTGYEKDYGQFLKQLEKNKVQVSQIKYIFLTHHHDDHAGFLNQLTQENQGINTILHEKAVPLLAWGANNIHNGGGIVNPVIFGLFRFKQSITPEWTLTFPAFRIRQQDILLSDDAIVLPKELRSDFLAVATPGHTTDSISLLYKNEYLFCGDMASNFLNWAGAKYVTLFNEDIATVYDSWRTVLDMNVQIIATAHGKPFEAKRLEENLDQYRQKDLVKFF